jgi:hypothetical protein
VQQETSQELLRGEGGHLSFLIAMGIILPVESNLVVLESQEAVIVDSDAMGVAGEIAEDMLRSSERSVSCGHSLAIQFSLGVTTLLHR